MVGVGVPFVVGRMLNDPDVPDEVRLELLRCRSVPGVNRHRTDDWQPAQPE
ncbi:MAG TPA: hypothetical protein VK898_20735 [Chloroflexota bacterium]|nr:hypothetical protein [Chloroflexota bacterium]